MRRLHGAVLLGLALLLAGCSSILRGEAPPAAQTESLQVLGLPNARFWLDSSPEPLIREARLMTEREAALLPAGARLPPANYLALSGGGDNGAYGAGLVVGWTASGRRPSFDVVTGISAGALIAPFAFLGPAYDDQLRDVFTGQAPTDILVVPRQIVAVFSLLFGEALADTSPLTRLIDRHANEAMLRAIAAEYAKGRLLLIGTTNLDMQRPVFWNIGAIAASGHPDALRLFRNILLASASIPGAFPPVLFDVESGGRKFQELHVDGGAATQVFLYPPSLQLRERAVQRQRTAWVVRNGRVDVEGSITTRGVISIARRSASTLLHFSGLGDISRIYLTTQRDGVDFRVAYIGSDFQAPRREPFDQAYMQALFDYGFAQGRDGSGWRDRPSAVGVFSPAPVSAAAEPAAMR
jgi:predicted acylesterase/phospholipase RssA